jgi:GAF domain
MRQGLISLLGTWWRSNQGELEACRRELSEALEREKAASDRETATSGELSESLERERATSEVLGIISSSPSDLQPVFEAILANATRLCEASYGTLWLREGEAFRAAALHGAVPAAYTAERRRGAFRPHPDGVFARAARTRQTVQVADMREEQAYLDRNPIAVTAVELGGVRTLVHVPMLKEDELIGAIAIYRQEVRPFTDKQIALVTNFASQAVIAIENARLLNELRESLQQQMATADVLKVISRSATDVQPVFETIARSAVDLCGATYGIVFRYDGELITMVAHHNLDQAALEAVHRIWPMRPDNRTVMGRTIVERNIVHTRRRMRAQFDFRCRAPDCPGYPHVSWGAHAARWESYRRNCSLSSGSPAIHRKAD